MTLEPFRSAMSIGQVGDTSLAVPSDINVRSAQQRVMDQVHTIARSKSRHSIKSGSGLKSPISPKNDSVFYDVQSIKTSPKALSRYNCMDGLTVANGSMNKGSFFGNGTINKASTHFLEHDSAMSRGTMNPTRSISRRVTSRQRSSSRTRVPPLSPTEKYQARVQIEGQTRATRGSRNSSRSVPDLTTWNGLQQRSSNSLYQTQQRMVVSGQNQQSKVQVLSSASSPQMVLNGPVSPAAQKSTLSQHSMTQSFVKRPPSNHSNGESKISVSKGKITIEGQKMDISMSEAIQYLYSQDEKYQLCGASFIQHSTYTEDKAKQQVFQLNGIPPLVALLQNPNLQIQETASAALRNLVYKNQGNKEEVLRCGGVDQIVQLLTHSQSAETKRHLTGLLWNLSSADSLKGELLKSALPVLTEHVVIPYADISGTNNNTDPDVFFNTTACLRNLSSAKLVNRQAMRRTSGLVDALVKYIQTCVANDNPDNKSVENCVCVLHNLTFQLEAECPQLFTMITSLARTPLTTRTSTAGPISCFSSQSSKIQQEAYFDYPVIEDNNPRGCAWLFHTRTLQAYLSLLETSENQATLEACCGSMQNLTASSGTVSAVLSQAIVQKLNGLRVISPLLKSDDVSLKRSVVSLLGNLSRHPRLHSSMARQALPPLTKFISDGVPNVTSDQTEMDETMATACHTAHTLLKAEQEMSKGLLSNGLINSLNNMSHNMNLPMSSKAAAVLLYNLWAQKDFQSYFKKQGMHKKAFVNDVTTAAHKSVVVIE